MKAKRLSQIIITAAIGITLIISILAFSYAWKNATFSKPYTFEILADGVTYVYMDAEIVKSDSALRPAVALPGAISEGLPYDVLKTNEEDPDSYIKRAASITEVEGYFTIYNEGYGYEPEMLAHDPVTGGTLFPKLDNNHRAVWKDDSDHSKGYVTEFHYTKYYFNVTGVGAGYDGEYIIDDKGNVLDEDPTGFNQEDYLVTDDAYAPEIDYETGNIQFTEFPVSIQPFPTDEYKIITYKTNAYKIHEIPREDATYGVVNFAIKFKASADPEVDDYFDLDDFVVNKIYFITKGNDESVPESIKDGNSSRIREYETISDDKTSGSFIIYGSESFFVYTEIYLAQPDELIDPILRDAEKIYMTVAISVEVEQHLEP